MPRYIMLFIFLVVSCSQAYIEETQNVVQIPLTVSYNDSSEGILVEWESQWDYVSTKIYRGKSSYDLKLHKSDVSTSKLMDTDVYSGIDYHYQIVAFNSKGRQIGQSAVTKGYRSYRSIDVVKKPINLQMASELSSSYIKFYWNGNVSDIFKVYRKTETSSDFEYYDTVYFDYNDSVMYIDHDVNLGEVYTYTVSVLGQDADKKIQEIFSDEEISGTTKDSPTGVVASYRDVSIKNGIRIAWDEKKGDEYYSVYRATSEHGEYQMISPFVQESYYIDRALPSVSIMSEGGVPTYPTYYYKIVANGDSGFSDVAAGQAVDQNDVFDSPKNFSLQFDATDFTLDVSWDTPDNIDDRSYHYQLIRYDANDVTNVLLENTLNTSYVVDLSPEDENTYTSFGKYYTYEIVAVNEAVNIGGLPSKGVYTHTTPGAVSISKVSVKDIEIVTTTNVHNIPTIVYIGGESTNVGTNVLEWHTSTTVGHIDVEWDKYHVQEQIAKYEVYRRVQDSGDDFKLIAEVDDTVYRDTSFTDEELPQTHEYQIIAVDFVGTKGDDSVKGGGIAFNEYKQADILPAPSYVSIPVHWSRKKHWSEKYGWWPSWTKIKYGAVNFSGTWSVGDESPQGAEKIKGKSGDSQHLYLVWDEVSDAVKYNVQVNKQNAGGVEFVNDTFLQIDNNSGDGKTRFFDISEGSGISDGSDDSATEADFTVTSVNANGVKGETRGILFNQVLIDFEE